MAWAADYCSSSLTNIKLFALKSIINKPMWAVTFGMLESRQVDELARVGQDNEYGSDRQARGRPDEQIAELQR